MAFRGIDPADFYDPNEEAEAARQAEREDARATMPRYQMAEVLREDGIIYAAFEQAMEPEQVALCEALILLAAKTWDITDGKGEID